MVVVGAGLGGLACALHLAGSGRQVTVLEREPVPGGRAGRLSVDGYEFDTGPTVLTMPDLIAEALGAVGEELTDWLGLTPLDPAYRAYYPDGSTLDVITDTTRMAAEIAASAVPARPTATCVSSTTPATCGSGNGPTSSSATSTRRPTCSPATC
ncbi:FAD-dependent oxidoreductase [Micromonospora sp. BRA006-A]|nr:FAD-dependent oxidoreductase [Micromonospora sp. BRA006-A]